MLNYLVFWTNYAILFLLHLIHNMSFACNLLPYWADRQIPNHPSKFSSAIKTFIKIHWYSSSPENTEHPPNSLPLHIMLHFISLFGCLFLIISSEQTNRIKPSFFEPLELAQTLACNRFTIYIYFCFEIWTE